MTILTVSEETFLQSAPMALNLAMRGEAATRTGHCHTGFSQTFGAILLPFREYLRLTELAARAEAAMQALNLTVADTPKKTT